MTISDYMKIWLATRPVNWERAREQRAALVKAGLLKEEGGLGPNHWLVSQGQGRSSDGVAFTADSAKSLAYFIFSGDVASLTPRVHPPGF
jgi:hypothetical protein